MSATIEQLRTALREEWFTRILPELDYEMQRKDGTPVEEGDWAWKQHPWFTLLDLTEDECLAALRSEPTDNETREDEK
jgi:hypothetical protein